MSESTAFMLFTSTKAAYHWEASFILRLRLHTTSSAVRAEPSENLRPCRSVIRKVTGFTQSAFVASPGEML